MVASNQSEVTFEEVGEEAVDLGPYEFVRCEVQGRYVVVIVREKIANDSCRR
jgi:hypothetical protein